MVGGGSGVGGWRGRFWTEDSDPARLRNAIHVHGSRIRAFRASLTQRLPLMDPPSDPAARSSSSPCLSGHSNFERTPYAEARARKEKRRRLHRGIAKVLVLLERGLIVRIVLAPGLSAIHGKNLSLAGPLGSKAPTSNRSSMRKWLQFLRRKRGSPGIIRRME